MAHLTYEESKKVVIKGMILLGIVTIIEVIIALLGKGYVVDGFHLPKWLMYVAMIGLSLYKARYILLEFMHLKYEVPSLRIALFLPLFLLVWGAIAFMQDGGTYLERRNSENDVHDPEVPALLDNAHDAHDTHDTHKAKKEEFLEDGH